MTTLAQAVRNPLVPGPKREAHPPCFCRPHAGVIPDSQQIFSVDGSRLTGSQVPVPNLTCGMLLPCGHACEAVPHNVSRVA